jgi:hypothetical protein
LRVMRQQPQTRTDHPTERSAERREWSETARSQRKRCSEQLLEPRARSAATVTYPARQPITGRPRGARRLP